MHLITHHIADETFAVIFSAGTFDAAQRTLGRWASDPELPAFVWKEACIMSVKIRRKLEATQCSRSS